MADPTRPGPFIDNAGREALNFGISIAVYGLVVLVAALMLLGIPLLMVGVVAWVVLASLAAALASQGLPVFADHAAGPLTRSSPACTAPCGRPHAGLAPAPG